MKKVKTSHIFCASLFLLLPHYTDLYLCFPTNPAHPQMELSEGFQFVALSKVRRMHGTVIFSIQFSIMCIVKILL